MSSKIQNLGANYDGFVKDGKPEGKGIANYDNGHRYDGEWSQGKKSGYGVYTWPDGSRYEGNWEDDYQSGQGLFVFPNGKRYEGGFSRGRYNGHGVMVFINEERLVAEWKDDYPINYRYYFIDGHYYEGSSINLNYDPPRFDGIVTDDWGNKMFFKSDIRFHRAGPRYSYLMRRGQGEVAVSSYSLIGERHGVFVIIKYREGYPAEVVCALYTSFDQAKDRYNLEIERHTCYWSEHLEMIQLYTIEKMSSSTGYIFITSREEKFGGTNNIQIYDQTVYGKREMAITNAKWRELEYRDYIYVDDEDAIDYGCYLQISQIHIEDFPDIF